MKLRSIDDMPDLQGKRVLVRVDHNVQSDEQGRLKDDHKIRISLPTLEELAKRGAKLTLMSHRGRPKGKVVEQLRTAAVVKHLTELSPVLRKSGFEYLENVRFDPREAENDTSFAQELASHGELFVNEAFASLHTYEETSTCAVAHLLPAYAGYHLLTEVDALSRTISDPKRPLVLILSGAKIKTKIPVIRRFLDLADHILLGGCIANTFIAAQGLNIAHSKYEPDFLDLAQELMRESEQSGKAKIHLPCDVVVASQSTLDTEIQELSLENVVGDMKIVDLGKHTIEQYMQEIYKAGTIIWNGPMGLYESKAFAHATQRIAETIVSATQAGALSVIGGGDTLDFHARYAQPLDVYSFVSSGGGAMIEFLSSSAPLPSLVPMMEEHAAAV